jgi:hypothetical protein
MISKGEDLDKFFEWLKINWKIRYAVPADSSTTHNFPRTARAKYNQI